MMFTEADRTIKESLKDILCYGKQNAVKGSKLAEIMGVRDDRMIRRAIRELIEEGVPVASSVHEPMGFYLANTEEEVGEYTSNLKARIHENQTRLNDFMVAVRSITRPGQLRLI